MLFLTVHDSAGATSSNVLLIDGSRFASRASAAFCPCMSECGDMGGEHACIALSRTNEIGATEVPALPFAVLHEGIWRALTLIKDLVRAAGGNVGNFAVFFCTLVRNQHRRLGLIS